MTVFGIAALLAPVVGPTLGGYITDNYGWRWIFYLNVPVGIARAWNVQRRRFRSGIPEDATGRASQTARPLRYARPGACLSVAMITWEVVLSKGQEWDWFGDPFWRVQTLAAAVCRRACSR